MNASLLERIAALPEPERTEALRSIPDSEYPGILTQWRGVAARPNQLRPGTPGASNPRKDWRYWLLQAGRGAGKTRTGAETVREWEAEGRKLIHLIAPTADDVRNVMIEGPGGLLSCYPETDRPFYEPSKRKITWASGAMARTFSSEEPERLRGPQCECVWGDEIAAWKRGIDTWDNMAFGLRLGDDPRGVFTSTPKPTPLFLQVVRDPHTVITRGSTYENRAFLAPGFFSDIIKKYEGTRLGRQELLAELLEDIPGALWTREVIERNRVDLVEVNWEVIHRIVVAIDPAVTHGEDSDETGIIVAGLTRSGHVIVIDDLTCRETPLRWAQIAVGAYRRWQAHRIVGEVNNGGALVEANLRAVATDISYRAVHASRGKAIRAEPVAALYEQGRVHHVRYPHTANETGDRFDKLEDQMCLVAGTLITTKRGFIPIERVRIGDWVLTRIGWCPVLGSCKTGDKPTLKIVTQDGFRLQITANHSIWANRKFTPAFEVQKGAILLTCHTQSSDNMSNSRAKSSFSIPTMGIIKPLEREADSYFTERFGGRLTGRYRADGTYTTGMRIGEITIYPTLKPSVHRHISSNISRAEPGVSAKKKGARGLSAIGTVNRQESFAVKSAELNESSNLKSEPAFVETIVESVIECEYPEPVYNLSVAEQPEFFANGILVHNCSFVPGVSTTSPDRLDALVWAITELVIDRDEIRGRVIRPLIEISPI